MAMRFELLWDGSGNSGDALSVVLGGTTKRVTGFGCVNS